LGYNLVEGAQLVSLTPSDTSVISIDENGRLTAISEGTSTITAKAKITTSQGDLVRDTTWTVNVGPQTVSLSESTVELNVGKYDYLDIETEPSGLPVVWTSSNENIATVNPQTGKVTALRAGKVTITATLSNGMNSSCEIISKQTLQYPETLITHQGTKDKLLAIKTLIDETELLFLDSKITQNEYSTLREQLQNTYDVAKADYIIVGDNPTSDYAYAVLGGNANQGSGSPFASNLTRGSTGISVIVFQRAMELLGYYEHYNGDLYGTFDDNTYDSAVGASLLDSYVEADGRMYFDKESYSRLFNANNAAMRTYAGVQEMLRLSSIHDEVARWVAAKVGGTYERIQNSIKNGNYNHTYYGYADVLKKGNGITYLWEVKPNKEVYKKKDGKAHQQIDRYIYASKHFQQTNTNIEGELVAGYDVGSFSIFSVKSNKYINVESFNGHNGDTRKALVLYEESAIPQYRLEEEPVSVDVPVPITISNEWAYEILEYTAAGVVVICSIVVVGAAIYFGAPYLVATINGVAQLLTLNQFVAMFS